MTDDATERVTVEVDAEAIKYGDGPYNFDPLSPKLAEGELSNGLDTSVQQVRKRDRNEVSVTFGTLGSGRVEVFFDTRELITAATRAADEAGVDLPAPEGTDD